MLYFITAAAFNEFGGSALSETFEYTTPRRPFPPTIESVVVLPSPASRRRLQEDAPPSLEREPFGRMAITVANTSDGGSREWLLLMLLTSPPRKPESNTARQPLQPGAPSTSAPLSTARSHPRLHCDCLGRGR